MSNLSRMVNVASGVSKDRLNILRTKGVDTVMSNARIVNGVADAADSIIEVGSDASSLGLRWCLNLDVMPLYEEVLKEVGLDNRMFVRKAERGGFENVHKLFTKLAGTGVSPDFVQIETEIFSDIPELSFGFEDQTRMLNALINAVKAACPECKVILSTSDSADNEKAKKWFNRFQVSGGKKFDIISLRYELSSETFYNLSINMSDLSRRFEAEILVDISGQKNVSSADIGLADLDSAVEIVPLDRGFGVVYSNEELGEVTLVA